MTTPTRAAATVLLLRDGPGCIEVFLVQRNRRSGFLPNAWVFPGGRVDAADFTVPATGVETLAEKLGLTVDLAAAYGVAAVRETWEEARLWVGGGPAPIGDFAGSSVDVNALVPWSWWVTPEVEPKRFDTRFFAVAADGPGQHDDQETVASGWFQPVDVLGRGVGFPIAPPTWWTLYELAGQVDVASALRWAAARRVARIQPILNFGEGGIELWLPGHPKHPDPGVDGLPHHVLYDSGRWVAWRDGQRLGDVFVLSPDLG